MGRHMSKYAAVSGVHIVLRREQIRSSTFASSAVVMTTSGQMIIGGHNEALSPAPFRINVPIMAMGVSGSDPDRMSTRRFLPPASLPVIGVPVILVIAAYPDMLPAGTRGAMLVNADRGTKFYNDLCVRHTEAERGSDDCVKNDFHCSPGYMKA